MAYDPVTGEYKREKTDVSKRLTNLLAKNNPYMQQAATRGRQSANRRGLLNSTMAVTAAESARIDAALPIASQDAAQAHESNLQGRNIQFQDISQQRDIESRRGLLQTELESRERMQSRDIDASRERLEAELGSRAALQTADLAAQKERLGMQLSQQERLTLEELRAAEQRLGMEISSRAELQEADLAATRERLELELGNRASLQEAELAAQKERLGMQLSQQEQLALEELRAAEDRLNIELGSRERMQGRDLELQERLANMNLAANERNAAAQIAQGFETTYSQTVSAIMSNPEIPASERQRYLDHAARVRDSNLNLIEQFYGIELDWNTPGRRPSLPYIPPPLLAGNRTYPTTRWP